MPVAFPPLGPEYDHFLYAVVCREANGMQLTMASAIARSGADPWQEAARVSRMPKDAALRVLARFIPERSGHDAASPTDPMSAEVLFALLPVRTRIIAPLAKGGRYVELTVFVLAAALLALVVLAPMFAQKSAGGAANRSDAPSPPISSDTIR